MSKGLLFAALTGLVLGQAPRLAAQAGDEAPPDSAAVADRIAQLDQQIRILARRWEIARDSLAAVAKSQPRAAAGRDGFLVRSADGDFQLRFRGYVQADGRAYTGDGVTSTSPNALLLRRVRPVTEVTLAKYFSARLMPDFGGNQVVLYDAHIDLRFAPQVALRAGKFKPPVGLERLQSATDIPFAERGLPTNLVPNRDIGAQLYGAFGRGIVTYAAGVFNGVPDLGNGNGDVTNDKGFVGRVFLQPFQRSTGLLRGLGIGVAASTGTDSGTVAAPALASYSTSGQQVIFRYRDSTIATGTRTRLAPQAYFYAGRFGLQAEYVISTQDLLRSGTAGTVEHRGWQLAGSFFLTRDAASYTTVTPKRGFDPVAHTWGALELVARVGELELDDAAFPTFATPAASVSRARAWGAGLNWHLARGVRLALNYDETLFVGGAATGDRATERFIVTRIQQAF